MAIIENYQKIKNDIPDSVEIIAACKGRAKEEVEQIIEAGAKYLGENYVQEAEIMHESLGEKAKQVKWHMIGHLQKNKINRTLKIFDFIQSIDSKEIAVALNERAERAGKVVPVYIEVNLGNEETKSGVRAEYEIIESLAKEISGLKFLRLEGLMAMEPQVDNGEKARPYFKKAKDTFEKIKLLNLPGAEIKTLSMGMSGSYRVAIEEGSNMVRLGAAIFGERRGKI
jgi:hypothetical protein